jgi:two-component system sensor histidine kinase ChvG
MDWATGIKKMSRPENQSARDNIFDLYWGGKERRITGLTLRIIGVNILALFTLFIVFLYMGQYHASVIKAKIENVGTEAVLISTALSEVVNEPQKLKRMAARFALDTGQEIKTFDQDGQKTFDSYEFGIMPTPITKQARRADLLLQGVRHLMNLLPQSKALPIYPKITSNLAKDYPDVSKAYAGDISVSVWHNEDGHIFLSTGAPLMNETDVQGVVLLTHTAYDIEAEISGVWRNITAVFIITFLIMIALSIYLSGVIAYPIKRLAHAAEGVRKGALGYADIPNYAGHHDEIGELSIALRQMTKALSDRMHAIEHFAADVAHELKNPLTSLRSAIETLGVVKKKADKKKLMDIVHHDLERIDRLISDISRSSRIDAELSRAKVEQVDLNDVLIQLLDVYRTPLNRKNKALEADVEGIKITLDIHADEHVMVWGLTNSLYQVFENLLSNALSFSKKGDHITIDVSTEAKAIYVSICDQGGGIEAKNIEDIFSRFYSRRPDAEKYGEYSGLGLAICKQIVETFDGQIIAENIESGDDRIIGACFTVVLKAVF